MNWKDPVFKAMDINGNWEDDPDKISKFYDYSCTTPSGMRIERSARFFSRLAFTEAIKRWNKNITGYVFTDLCEGVNYRAREDNHEASFNIGG